MNQAREWKDLPEYPGAQELAFEYGTIQINSSNLANDRGGFRVTTDVTIPVSRVKNLISRYYFDEMSAKTVSLVTNLISRYYFDEMNAKIDVYRWLEIIDVCIKERCLESPEKIVIVSGEPWVIHGKTCILSLLPIQMEKIKFFVLDVAVPSGVGTRFAVDVPDAFPRHYTDLSIARQEAVDWLQRRGQYITDEFHLVKDLIENASTC